MGTAVAMVAALFVVFPSSGSACSCAPHENPRSSLALTEAAFVGTVEHVDDSLRGDPTYRYRVEHAVKGPLGDTITVHSGRGCHLEGRPGQREGLLLAKDAKGRWTSHLCNSLGAERLLEASRPLPAPDGRGPPAFVVGAGLGEHRSLLLDARRRMLAYGEGPGHGAGNVRALDVCPGGVRVVEGLGGLYPERSRVLLTVRAVAGMRAERHATAEDLSAPGGHPSVTSVQCRTPDAGHVDIAVRNGDPTTVLRSSGGTWRQVWTGNGEVELAHGAAIAVIGLPDRVERLDLDTGAVTTIARGATAWPRSLTPDGTRLALLGMSTSYAADRLSVIDVHTGAVRATHSFDPPLSSASVAWVDDRIVAVEDRDRATLSFFDERLHVVGSVPGWRTHQLLGAGGMAFGMTFEPGVILYARPTSTTAEPFARLPDGATHAIAPLPTAPTSLPSTPTAVAAATTTTTSSDAIDGLPAARSAPVPPSSRRARPWGTAALAIALLGATAWLSAAAVQRATASRTRVANSSAGTGRPSR